MAVLGLAVVVLGYVGYLTMLFGLRRFTYRTWLFDAVLLVGIALALVGLAAGDTALPAWIAIGLGVAWFPLTRRELTLVGSERLTLRPGDVLPHFSALRPDGTPITDQDVVARAPALLVLYRGWWCPSTRALLDELLRDHERLTAAGLTTFAASVDPPAIVAGYNPVLVMDVWEHAFLLEFPDSGHAWRKQNPNPTVFRMPSYHWRAHGREGVLVSATPPRV